MEGSQPEVWSPSTLRELSSIGAKIEPVEMQLLGAAYQGIHPLVIENYAYLSSGVKQ